MESSDAEQVPPAADSDGHTFFGESHWPPAIAVFVFLVLNVADRLWLPSSAILDVPWLLPTAEVAIIVVLIFGRPAHLTRQLRWLHPTAVALVCIMVASALWATVRLINDLIWGSELANEPALLLASGGLVWLGNVLSFALLYWLLDGGGPARRHLRPRPADFAFTQHLNPDVGPAGWRPVFLDYLHLGFTK